MHKILAFVVVATLLFGACTDEGGTQGSRNTETVKVGAFMEDVCTAMSDWLADFLAGYQEVRSMDPNASVEEGKQALDRFLDDAIKSTNELVVAIEDAGEPDVEGGSGYATRLTTSLEQAEAALTTAREELAGLPNDPTRFRDAAIALGDTVREQLTAAGEAISAGVPAPVRDAQENTAACQSLGGAISPSGR